MSYIDQLLGDSSFDMQETSATCSPAVGLSMQLPSLSNNHAGGIAPFVHANSLPLWYPLCQVNNAVGSPVTQKPAPLKKFCCPYCVKTFGYKQHMKSHVKTVHLRIKEFKCKFCPKAFGEKSAVSKHTKALHPNESNNQLNEKRVQVKTNVESSREEISYTGPESSYDDLSGLITCRFVADGLL